MALQMPGWHGSGLQPNTTSCCTHGLYWSVCPQANLGRTAAFNGYRTQVRPTVCHCTVIPKGLKPAKIKFT